MYLWERSDTNEFSTTEVIKVDNAAMTVNLPTADGVSSLMLEADSLGQAESVSR